MKEPPVQICQRLMPGLDWRCDGLFTPTVVDAPFSGLWIRISHDDLWRVYVGELLVRSTLTLPGALFAIRGFMRRLKRDSEIALTPIRKKDAAK